MYNTHMTVLRFHTGQPKLDPPISLATMLILHTIAKFNYFQLYVAMYVW